MIAPLNVPALPALPMSPGLPAPPEAVPGGLVPPVVLSTGTQKVAAGLVVDFRGLAGLYNAIFTGLKAPALRGLAGSLQQAMPLARRAAGIQAIASGISNGLDLMQGRATAGKAVSQFTRDVMGAFAGGTGAALLAGVMVGAFGVTGVMAGAVGVVGGLIGYGLGHSLLESTGIPGMISRGITRVLDG